MFNEFEHIAIRAFDAGFNVGDTMPNSFVWIDGECNEAEQLNGASGIKVTSEADLNKKLEAFRSMYAFSGRIVYVIGGDFVEHGEDDGEIVISKAKVLRIIG